MAIFNKQKKLLNKKNILILCIVLFSLSFISFFCLAIAKAFFRPIEYQVRVSEKIYNEYIEKSEFLKATLAQGDLPFVFVKDSDDSTKIGKFGKIPVTAATITFEKSMPLLSQSAASNTAASNTVASNTVAADTVAADTATANTTVAADTATANTTVAANTTTYPLYSAYILPLINADFSKVGTAEDSLFSPKLSLSFSEENGFVAKNTRAIPVDSVYANQSDYKLTVTGSAVCTIFVAEISDALKEVCTHLFSEQNESDASALNAALTDTSIAHPADAALTADATPDADSATAAPTDTSIARPADTAPDAAPTFGALTPTDTSIARPTDATPDAAPTADAAPTFGALTADATPITPEREQVAFVASVGDLMVARGVEDILINEQDGLQKVFKSTLPILQSNDITIVNLEGVVTNSTKNAIKTYTFKFKKQVLPFLQKAGFNYFMQTNNHCYDFGEAGFLDTLKAFEEYNIPSSGIGKNAEEAKQFYHTEVNGQKFAIISCGAYPVENSGFNGKKTATATENRAGILWLTDEVYDLVKAEKEKGNFVIVNVHGGEEYMFNPNKTQKESYRKLCDYGADVVFGSHPHVLQPNEWYNGSLIVYSQGNFVFNGMEDMKGATDTEIVRLGILNGKIAYCEIYPAKISGKTVDLK